MRINVQISEETATFTLSRAEALAFFEFLSRFDQDEQLDIRDQAEELLLWHLHGALERVLVEPFLPDYKARLEVAHQQIRASCLNQ